MMGKGSVKHNTRAFTAKNVDKERSRDNVEFCHSDIKEVYQQLFGEALERYNAKQKRNDRKIENYYEKIRQGKQEKLFHEVIFQIGNKNDMNAKDWQGQVAKDILVEFMEDFQKRNQNLHVFSAHLHMDEETPHLHIDFIPFIRNSKRGLDTRVSLKGALAEQGFSGGTRGATEWNQWIEAEKQELSKVMERHGIRWKKLGMHRKHLSVLDYEKQERAKEVAELDKQIEKSETALHSVKNLVDNRLERAENLAQINENLKKANDRLYTDNSKLENAYTEAEQCHLSLSEKNRILQMENENLQDENGKLKFGNSELEKQRENLREELCLMIGVQARVELDIRSFNREKQWQLPDPGTFTSAKFYCENTAKPLVDKLKELVRNLIIRCTSLTEQVRNLTDKVKQQALDIDWYKGKLLEQANTAKKFQEQAAYLERVKLYAGTDKVQEMVEAIKAIERLESEQKRIQRSYDSRYYR
ncbi:MAG: recombinase [Lachnospiraceae bacterium]|nr:recombinase [Lachnospiraceae bacterium]